MKYTPLVVPLVTGAWMVMGLPFVLYAIDGGKNSVAFRRSVPTLNPPPVLGAATMHPRLIGPLTAEGQMVGADLGGAFGTEVGGVVGGLVGPKSAEEFGSFFTVKFDDWFETSSPRPGAPTSECRL
ncbi:hypothetical protein DFH09DRAFT_1099701 [Mycena vulgaris]|nr:hypothetical protein DFH09DRAFT_1099701 [Mycena vulgaris]